jgi:hypothetical protein
VSVLAPTAIQLVAPATLYVGGPPTNAALNAQYTGTNANAAAFNGITFKSSDTNVATIGGTGQILTWGAGTVTLSATYGGLNTTAPLTVTIAPGYQPATLVHRYSFTADANDSVGTANGTVVGTGTFTNGQLSLPGGPAGPDGSYVDLPNELISKLTNVTLEAWITWNGPTGALWQRVFDIGSDVGGEGQQTGGLTWVYMTTMAGWGTGYAEVGGDNAVGTFTIQGVNFPGPIPVGQQVQVALAYDYSVRAMRLYLDGNRVATAAAATRLSSINDYNVWLGRSNWQDDHLNGLFNEFRVYDGAMLDNEVAASFAAGPDQLPVPGISLGASFSNGSITVSWPTAGATGFGLETSAALAPAASWGPVSTPPVQQGDKYVVTLPTSTPAAYYRLHKP